VTQILAEAKNRLRETILKMFRNLREHTHNGIRQKDNYKNQKKWKFEN
jgi:hypothetical protein